MPTKLTLEHEGRIYSALTPDDGLSLPTMIDDLIVPVLRAAGFDEHNIGQYIPDVAVKND